MEPCGSLWKTRECSTGKLGNREGRAVRNEYEKGRTELCKCGAVRDNASEMNDTVYEVTSQSESY